MILTRGDDIDLNCTFIDEETNTPLNITGSTVYFTAKPIGDQSFDSADSSAIIKKDQTVHTYPLQGKTTIHLTNTETKVAPGNYEYDFQVKDIDGKILSTKSGTLTIEKDITCRV